MEKQSAEKLLAVGEFPLPEDVDKITLAAMMQAINMIYNLEETVTKT
jgi:hypothetical protein